MLFQRFCISSNPNFHHFLSYGHFPVRPWRMNILVPICIFSPLSALHNSQHLSHRPFFKAFMLQPLVVTVISLLPNSQVIDWPPLSRKSAAGNLPTHIRYYGHVVPMLMRIRRWTLKWHTHFIYLIHADVQSCRYNYTVANLPCNRYYTEVSQAVLLYILSDIHHINTMLLNKRTEDNLKAGSFLWIHTGCLVSLTKNKGVGLITGCYAATMSSALSSAVWQ